jgi:hydrocephalus-inducing protein
LRIVKGYDEYNTVLLPPRAAGEKLPNEFYEYYEEQLKKLEEEEKKQKPGSNLEVQTESGGK